MKELRTICSLCELRLLAAPARPRLHATSRYSTLARTAPSADDWTEAERRLEAAAAADAEKRGRNSSRKPVAPPTSGPPRRPRTPYQARDRKRDGRTERPDGSAAVATFMSVVEGQKHTNTTGEQVSHSGSSYMDLLQDVATLEGMLAKQTASSAASCFAFFDAKIYPRLVQTGSSESKTMNNRIATNAFRKMLPEKYRDFDSKAFPSVTRITQILLELGILNAREWAKLMLAFLQHICRLSTSPTDYASIESYESAMARRDSHLHDLVGAWKVFHVQRFKAMRVGDAQRAAEELRLPSLDDQPGPRAPDDPNKAFARLFPLYNPQVLLRVKHAAIATYVVVTDPVNANIRGPLRDEVARFVDTIGRILSRVPPASNDLAAMFKDYEALRNYITLRWPDVEAKLAESLPRNPSSRSVLRSGPSPALVDYTAESLHRRVGQALRSRDIRLAKATWNHFWGEEAVPSPEQKEFLVEHADLFNYFIMAYMSMRQPGLAIQVWNSMERIGIRATLKSWNSMLEGCRRAKNHDGLRVAWEKLLASGIKLDTAIWTARIAGLIEVGEEDAGLRALAEMARTWRDQDRDARARAMAVRPTIEPVNAALAGLLLRDNTAAANDVLKWAGRQGISPDIYTFNTLLRPLVRQGKSDEVEQVFAMMKAAGVEADVATYTIILDGALSRIGDEPPQKQIATVTGILGQMEAAGIRANMQVYAKMIYLLLQEGGDKAGESVKAVLAHIWARGLELTSHIYTMLAEHYFSRDPPDGEAVDTLIETRRLYDNPDVDLVFWERVLKGYCQMGAVDKALRIYDKIESAFITVGTLHELLSALLVAGEMEAAARVVALARKIKEATEQGGSRIQQNNKRFLRHRFWRLAERYGLLQEETEA